LRARIDRVVGALTAGVIGQQNPSVRTDSRSLASSGDRDRDEVRHRRREPALAARAGVQVLEHGGNAVDAAIATNAVMAWSNRTSTASAAISS